MYMCETSKKIWKYAYVSFIYVLEKTKDLAQVFLHRVEKDILMTLLLFGTNHSVHMC